MTQGLTADQVREYRESGVLYPLPLLGPDELVEYRKAYEELESFHGGRIPPNATKQLHLHFPWAFDLATDARVLDYVEAILGPDILVHGSSLFCKKPNDAGFVSWHQDGYYMGLEKPGFVTAWIALSESNRENGCLRVIPGSHVTSLPHVERPSANSILSSGIVVAAEPDERLARDIELLAGQMSLHHVNLVHGSKPNTSGTERVGFALRYIATEVRQKLVHHQVILARGNDRFGNYEVMQTRPAGGLFECAESQRRAHALYASRRREASNQPEG